MNNALDFFLGDNLQLIVGSKFGEPKYLLARREDESLVDVLRLEEPIVFGDATLPNVEQSYEDQQTFRWIMDNVVAVYSGKEAIIAALKKIPGMEAYVQVVNQI